MKILITGGLGHIGSFIVENINKIKNIKKIYIIDNFSTERYCSLFNLPKSNKKIIFYQKDLSKKNILNKFVKVDVVINLASLTDAANSLKIKKLIYKNNLGIFNNVLKYCEKKSAKLIHISSTSVYGEQKGLVDENCNYLRPKSPYAEIRDNLLDSEMRPIDLLRFKLSFFGASKFDPKSDLWTRITLFQGAPLPDQFTNDESDEWPFPISPV